jgi:hypothetical protein
MKRKWMVAAILLLVTGSVGAEKMPVPFELQAELFKRIFSYDRALSDNESPVVFIVYATEEPMNKEELVRAFDKAGILSRFVRPAKLQEQAEIPSAVYLLPDVNTAQVEPFCTSGGILSISGVPSFADRGDVSVSIGEQNNRPQIIINLNRLRSEGHELSAELLKLARVIQK